MSWFFPHDARCSTTQRPAVPFESYPTVPPDPHTIKHIALEGTNLLWQSGERIECISSSPPFVQPWRIRPQLYNPTMQRIPSPTAPCLMIHGFLGCIDALCSLTLKSAPDHGLELIKRMPPHHSDTHQIGRVVPGRAGERVQDQLEKVDARNQGR